MLLLAWVDSTGMEPEHAAPQSVHGLISGMTQICMDSQCHSISGAQMSKNMRAASQRGIIHEDRVRLPIRALVNEWSQNVARCDKPARKQGRAHRATRSTYMYMQLIHSLKDPDTVLSLAYDIVDSEKVLERPGRLRKRPGQGSGRFADCECRVVC